MIAKLTGIVDVIAEESLVLDVRGVGYLVFCSSRTLNHLALGEGASLLIETHVREDQIALYGFLEDLARAWFGKLVMVQGVGARVALAILGVFSINELIDVIIMNDKTAMIRTPGVGPKLAQRILGELKDKVGSQLNQNTKSQNQQGASPNNAEKDMIVKDAVSALVNLGYSPSRAFAAVSEVSCRSGEDISVEILIRDSLLLLGPSEGAMRSS